MEIQTFTLNSDRANISQDSPVHNKMVYSEIIERQKKWHTVKWRK